VELRVLREGEGLKIILEGCDYSIGDIIRHELLERGFPSGLTQPHLLEKRFVIYTKAGMKDLKEAIEAAIKNVEELKEEVKKSLKVSNI